MTRARALDTARILFLLLTVGFAWWGFRGRWGDVADAVTDTSALGLGMAVLATLVGLALTAVLFRLLLVRLGSEVAAPVASAIFLVGQLGKYLPGTVWSFAAQAQLGSRHRIPARRSVAASALFLYLHTATGAVVGAAAAAAGVLDVPGPSWLWALGTAATVAGLLPPVVRRVGGVVAGRRIEVGVRDVGRALPVMAGVWVAYGVGVLALLGPAGGDLAVAVSAFALSHVAGVLLVFAPAGLGAREAVLVAVLRPVASLEAAVAVALLARVVHTASDFAIAALAWARLRGSSTRGRGHVAAS